MHSIETLLPTESPTCRDFILISRVFWFELISWRIPVTISEKRLDGYPWADRTFYKLKIPLSRVLLDSVEFIKRIQNEI